MLDTLPPPVVAPVRRRRPWLRLLRAVAAVLLVGGLSFGMVAMDSHQAEASAGLLLAPALAGAAEGALPLAAWLGAVTPAGWVILGGVAVAAGLYYTKDYWLPYVTGAFGAPKDKDTPTQMNASYTLHSVLTCPLNCPVWSQDKKSVTVQYGVGANSDQNANYAYFGMVAKCKNDANGSIGYQDKNGYWGIGPGSAWKYSYTFTPCPLGYTPVAWTIGGGNGPQVGSYTPNLNTSEGNTPAYIDSCCGVYERATKNVINGGEWGEAGFDPKSPEVKYTSSVECIKPDGTKFTLTAETTGDQKGLKMPSCAAAVPGSHGTGKTTVTGTPPGSSTPQTLYTTPAITGTPYPKCEPGNPGAGCVLSVSVDGKPCVIGDWQCAHWADLKTEAPARLQCNYGPYLGIAIDTCNPLERAYETGGTVANESNTDGNPSTRNDTDPAGNPINKTDLGTPPVAVPGGPSAVPPAGATTEQANCFPSGWAQLNPVEWVMKPVGCALDSAFKPKKDIQTRVTGMQAKFNDKVPISWFTAGKQGVTGGTCPTNWALDVSGQHISLICGTPVEGILLAFRPIMGAMLVIAALWPLIRSLFYAAIPVFKVTPS